VQQISNSKFQHSQLKEAALECINLLSRHQLFPFQLWKFRSW